MTKTKTTESGSIDKLIVGLKLPTLNHSHKTTFINRSFSGRLTILYEKTKENNADIPTLLIPIIADVLSLRYLLKKDKIKKPRNGNAGNTHNGMLVISVIALLNTI